MDKEAWLNEQFGALPEPEIPEPEPPKPDVWGTQNQRLANLCNRGDADKSAFARPPPVGIVSGPSRARWEGDVVRW